MDADRTRKSARHWPAIVIAVVALGSLSACGEDSPITVPSPTGSLTRTGLPSLTGSLPSRTRTTESEVTPESSTTEEPTSEETTSETTTEPTSEPTTEPTTATVTRETEVTVTSTPTPSDEGNGSDKKDKKDKKAKGDDGEDGIPAWVWWLLAALAVAGALLALLLPRTLRRRRWDGELASGETEARWLAGDLLPQLQQSASVAEVAGGWQVSAGRVAALEDQLTGLASTAPDEARTNRATALRDAVRTARGEVDALIASGSPSPSRDLSAVAGRLTAALGTVAPAG